MKAATVKNRSIQDDQLNMGTLVVKERSGEMTLMKIMEQQDFHKGVAALPPIYQTNTSTWAAFGGPRSSYYTFYHTRLRIVTIPGARLMRSGCFVCNFGQG